MQTHHAELRQIPAELLEALGRPGRHRPPQVALGNVVFLLEQLAIFLRREQPERRFVDRRILDRIERYALHEQLQAFGQRRLAATDRAQQVENLLALLQPLSGMTEIGDDLLDRLFHAVELGKGGIAANDLVGENTGKARILGRVDRFRFPDGTQHPLGGVGVDTGIFPAQL